MALTPLQLQAKIDSDPRFAALVNKYGKPAPIDCSSSPVGTICMETACQDGHKLVIKCSGRGECTDHQEVKC